MDLYVLFDVAYTDQEKDVFTDAADRKTQNRKTRLNDGYNRLHGSRN